MEIGWGYTWRYASHHIEDLELWVGMRSLKKDVKGDQWARTDHWGILMFKGKRQKEESSILITRNSILLIESWILVVKDNHKLHGKKAWSHLWCYNLVHILFFALSWLNSRKPIEQVQRKMKILFENQSRQI